MASTTVNVHEAKTHFSKLLARVERGERITVARAGKPIAKLVPADQPQSGSLPQHDPLLNLDEFGFDGPGGKLTDPELNRLVYGD
jgi:prevent-host-death family protein